MWSGQAEEQIIGRVHRRPNENEVHVYYPRVVNTSDMILGHFASIKEGLLDTFMSKSLIHK